MRTLLISGLLLLSAQIVQAEDVDSLVVLKQDNTSTRFVSNGSTISYTADDSGETYYYGDVNNDKAVNVTDMVALLGYVLETDRTGTFMRDYADINQDGSIGIGDIVGIVNFLLSSQGLSSLQANGASLTITSGDDSETIFVSKLKKMYFSEHSSLDSQSLNVNIGNVTYAITAANAGEIVFNSSKDSITAGERTYSLNDLSDITIDETTVTDGLTEVAYNDTSATVRIQGCCVPHVDASISGAHVALLQDSTTTSELAYSLSGSSSDGSLYMDGSYKATFIFNGVSLTNPDSAAVNIRDGKRIDIQLTDGTTNTLEDGSDGDWKACLMVKGHTEFKGAGSLTLTGNTSHGFWGKEYVELKKSLGSITVAKAVDDGFNVNQYLQMNGGTVTISNVGDDGIQIGITDDSTDELNGQMIFKKGTLNIDITADAAKGIKCDSMITVSGGEMTITTSGNGAWDEEAWDTKACACISTDSIFYMTAGTLTLNSTGTGAKGIKSDGRFIVTGGTIEANAKGAEYTTTYTEDGSSSDSGSSGWSGGGNAPSVPGGREEDDNGYISSSPKGIKSLGDMTISGGSITVTSAAHEAIETKSAFTMNDGILIAASYDDAINSASHMYINGGYVCGQSSSNDGIDANGNFYITGGKVLAFGAGGAECGIDAAEGYALYITGGTLIANGAGNNSVSSTSGSQPVISYSASTSKFAIETGSSAGTSAILAFDASELPNGYSSSSSSGNTGGPGGFSPGGGSSNNSTNSWLISSPSLTSGTTYYLYTSPTITTTSDTWLGLTEGATVSGGTRSASSSASTTYSGR